jgi:hypothetical protein
MLNGLAAASAHCCALWRLGNSREVDLGLKQSLAD